MSDGPVSLSLLSLTDHLQHLTEALAATRTEGDVLSVLLSPAMTALNALAGAVLLLDPQQRRLSVAALQGAQAQTVWQDGPLAQDTPAGDVLSSGEPLYFEHAGTLKAAYPDLETVTGGVTAVATAVLPLRLDGQPLGVLILDFREPHEFTPEERRFLTILATQGSLALDRAAMLEHLDGQGARRQLQARTAELETERAFLGTTLDSLGEAIVVCDAQGRLVRFAGQAVEIHGQDAQPMDPGEWARQYHLYHPDLSRHLTLAEIPLYRAWQGETVQGAEMAVWLPGQRPRHLLINGGPLWTSDGRPNGAVVAQRDVTALYEQRGLLQQRTAELDTEQGAMQTFVQFTEAASRIEDVGALARLALDTLQQVLPGSSSVFYTLAPTSWQPLSWTSNLAPELLAVLQQGLPLGVPIFTELLRTRAPVFIDGWSADEQQVEHTERFQTVAAYPVEQQGEVRAVLSVALQHSPRWSAAQQALIRAIGRSFSLLYDRIAAADQLRQQRAEAQGRGRVLEVLAELTAEMTSRTGDFEMIRRAQAQILELLPPGHAAYWEPEGDQWRMRAHVNDVGNAELMAMLHAGLPIGQAPTLDRPWTTGEPLYQDVYQEGSDVAQELTTHVFAVASLPVGRGEHQRGVINFTTFQAHRWGQVDRALLETLARGLWLALERASYTHRLEEERAGLAAFAAFTEAVGSERDVPTLARQAVIALRAAVPGISVAYYEQTHDQWVGRVWSEDVPPDVVEQMQAGVSAAAPDFARAVQTGTAVFAEGWDAPGNDLSEAAMYSAAGFVPLVVGGHTHSLLTVGLQTSSRWSEHERSIVRAVGQGLTLALERAASVEALATRTAQLEQTNQELLLSNRELEAFTYSASHDLRTPVRHVQGFTELALRALEREQPDKVRRNLGVVGEATDRMTAMIDAMLMLSRVGRQTLQLLPCDLAAVVAQAQQDAQLEFQEQEVVWELGALPVVRADKTLLQQLMTNLLSNAVKFSRGPLPAHIRVWAEQRPTEVVVSVQDQGAGFNMAYAEKLFGAFQRLHTQQEFSGTGIGLATVRRIVARHGGRVWAEGAVGQGATFSFSLPQ